SIHLFMRRLISFNVQAGWWPTGCGFTNGAGCGRSSGAIPPTTASTRVLAAPTSPAASLPSPPWPQPPLPPPRRRTTNRCSSNTRSRRPTPSNHSSNLYVHSNGYQQTNNASLTTYASKHLLLLLLHASRGLVDDRVAVGRALLVVGL